MAEEIERDILFQQPLQAFESLSDQVPPQTPTSQRLLLPLMPCFLAAKTSQPLDFHPDLPRKINDMLRLVTQQQSRNQVVIYGSDVIHRHHDVIVTICTAVCKLLSQEVVLSILLTNARPSDLVTPLPPQWAAILNGPTDLPFHIAAAMAVRSKDVIRDLISKHNPGDLKHDFFGSPLINAIKLGDISTVRIISRYLKRSNKDKTMTPEAKDVLLNNVNAAFPTYEAIENAILYNNPDILHVLADLIGSVFGEINSKHFNAFLSNAARHGDAQTMRAIYSFRRDRTWMLAYDTMSEVCKTGDYHLIFAAFANAQHRFTHHSSRWHPFHIAVRNNIEAAQAVYDTGRININEAVASTMTTYWNEPVTALDVAIHKRDPPMIKWLLDHGAEYRRRFPPRMPGNVYNMLRNKAIADDPRMAALPPFGQYHNMSPEAQSNFRFDLGR
ncbi:hypothetical protein GMOD_00008849 [Pyrenophora seminiperda CCB06]|uniref:Ankyrin repeat n=1 Tax=Pyrenophora seminiperda CCB06 TaxID=1302712 RepID=A0A3M7M5Y3_9PLEO|nr:hypothetical protein GMOD_00008849 [Pyrenophora seminiperda CCB06]